MCVPDRPAGMRPGEARHMDARDIVAGQRGVGVLTQVGVALGQRHDRLEPVAEGLLLGGDDRRGVGGQRLGVHGVDVDRRRTGHRIGHLGIGARAERRPETRGTEPRHQPDDRVHISDIGEVHRLGGGLVHLDLDRDQLAPGARLMALIRPETGAVTCTRACPCGRGSAHPHPPHRLPAPPDAASARYSHRPERPPSSPAAHPECRPRRAMTGTSRPLLRSNRCTSSVLSLILASYASVARLLKGPATIKIRVGH